MDGCLVINFEHGLIDLIPHAGEGAFSVKWTIMLGNTGDTIRRMRCAPHESQNISHADVFGGAFEPIAAIKAAFGFHPAGCFQLAQDHLQKAQRDSLGMRNLGDFFRTLPPVLGKLKNSPQSILTSFGCNRHGALFPIMMERLFLDFFSREVS